MRILFSLLLSLSLVACGDDDTIPASDGGPTPDAATGTDAGGADAGGADAGGTDAGGTDAGSTDAGSPGDRAQALIDALATGAEGVCGCDYFEAEGYANAIDCAAVTSVSEPFQECYRTGFDSLDATGQDALECYGTTQSELGTCLSAAGCDDEDAVAVCNATAETAFEACGQEAVFGAFETLALAASTCATTAADTCPDGDASGEIGASVFMGSTVGGANNYDDEGECNYETPERTHVWTAPSAGSFTFDTEGSDYDTNLALFADCEATEALACNDDGVGDTLYSAITRTFEAGESVLVVVEGYSGNAGNYRVNINPDTPDKK